MSRTEEQDYDGITWEEELEDDTLAMVQKKLENEFDADFSEQDFEKKGFSRDGLPFYTGVTTELDFWSDGETEEVEVFVKRNGEMNMIEYWADSGEVMEQFREYLDIHSKTSKGEMLEPYEIKSVKDTDVLKILQSLEDHYEIEGPERNPGKGETRIYPVRTDHLENPEETGDIGNSTDDETELLEDSEVNYTPQNHFLPGEAQFQVRGETPEEFELNATLRIKEQRDHKGIYKLKIDADYDERQSQRLLTYQVERWLNEE